MKKSTFLLVNSYKVILISRKFKICQLCFKFEKKKQKINSLKTKKNKKLVLIFCYISKNKPFFY